MLTGSFTTRPARIRAGQRAIPGTRTPPSSHEPLAPMKGPAEPGPFGEMTGPLSLVNRTSALVQPQVLEPLHEVAHRRIQRLDRVAAAAAGRAAREVGCGGVRQVGIAVVDRHVLGHPAEAHFPTMPVA